MMQNKTTVLRLEFTIPDYMLGKDSYIKLTDHCALKAQFIEFDTSAYWKPGKRELFFQDYQNNFLYMATKDPERSYEDALADGISDAYGKLRSLIDNLPKLGLALIERYTTLSKTRGTGFSPLEPFGVDSGEEYYTTLKENTTINGKNGEK